MKNKRIFLISLLMSSRNIFLKNDEKNQLEKFTKGEARCTLTLEKSQDDLVTSKEDKESIQEDEQQKNECIQLVNLIRDPQKSKYDKLETYLNWKLNNFQKFIQTIKPSDLIKTGIIDSVPLPNCREISSPREAVKKIQAAIYSSIESIEDLTSISKETIDDKLNPKEAKLIENKINDSFKSNFAQSEHIDINKLSEHAQEPLFYSLESLRVPGAMSPGEAIKYKLKEHTKEQRDDFSLINWRKILYDLTIQDSLHPEYKSHKQYSTPCTDDQKLKFYNTIKKIKFLSKQIEIVEEYKKHISFSVSSFISYLNTNGISNDFYVNTSKDQEINSTLCDNVKGLLLKILTANLEGEEKIKFREDFNKQSSDLGKVSINALKEKISQYSYLESSNMPKLFNLIDKYLVEKNVVEIGGREFTAVKKNSSPAIEEKLKLISFEKQLENVMNYFLDSESISLKKLEASKNNRLFQKNKNSIELNNYGIQKEKILSFLKQDFTEFLNDIDSMAFEELKLSKDKGSLPFLIILANNLDKISSNNAKLFNQSKNSGTISLLYNQLIQQVALKVFNTYFDTEQGKYSFREDQLRTKTIVNPCHPTIPGQKLPGVIDIDDSLIINGVPGIGKSRLAKSMMLGVIFVKLLRKTPFFEKITVPKNFFNEDTMFLYLSSSSDINIHGNSLSGFESSIYSGKGPTMICENFKDKKIILFTDELLSKTTSTGVKLFIQDSWKKYIGSGQLTVVGIEHNKDSQGYFSKKSADFGVNIFDSSFPDKIVGEKILSPFILSETIAGENENAKNKVGKNLSKVRNWESELKVKREPLMFYFSIDEESRTLREIDQKSYESSHTLREKGIMFSIEYMPNLEENGNFREKANIILQAKHETEGQGQGRIENILFKTIIKEISINNNAYIIVIPVKCKIGDSVNISLDIKNARCIKKSNISSKLENISSSYANSLPIKAASVYPDRIIQDIVNELGFQHNKTQVEVFLHNVIKSFNN